MQDAEVYIFGGALIAAASVSYTIGLDAWEEREDASDDIPERGE